MNKTLLCALTISAAAVAANADVVSFEGDTLGYVPNGFQSADSGVLTFNNTGGGPLEVYASPIGETVGNGLLSLSDDTNGLEMLFSVSQTSLSFDFGNDQDGWASPGDLAVLRLYQGATEVGLFAVELNLNDSMDQSISGTFAGGFDRATFFYTTASFNPIGLTECVDNITFAPTPGAAALLGLGGLAGGRRRR